MISRKSTEQPGAETTLSHSRRRRTGAKVEAQWEQVHTVSSKLLGAVKRFRSRCTSDGKKRPSIPEGKFESGARSSPTDAPVVDFFHSDGTGPDRKPRGHQY